MTTSIGRLRLLIVVPAMLAVAASVRADLLPAAEAASAFKAPVAGEEAACSEPIRSQRVDDLLAGVLAWPGRALAIGKVGCELGRAGSEGNVLSLPPGPSSANLFLVALSGFSAWSLGRSARKIHLGALPEWYHTGGAAQVGRATALDLDFSRDAHALCRFESNKGEAATRSSLRWLRLLEPIDGFGSQWLPLGADPRGPPLGSVASLTG